MIDDIVAQIKKILFFLENFDACWKSDAIKDNFPSHARDILEDIDLKIKNTSNYNDVLNSFAKWNDIGVWNTSDLLTLLLTSRLHMTIADALNKKNKELIKNVFEYIIRFINYLLSTNIHPPKKDLDEKHFYDTSVPFPSCYEDAQNNLRDNIADYYAKAIFLGKNGYVKELEGELVETIENEIDLKKLIRGDRKKGFLKDKTPPFLLKNTGLAKELFLYYKLISEDIGYLLPTLLYQRVFKGVYNSITNIDYKQILTAVPDFIIIRGGRVRGIELGRERGFFGTGKGALISKFSGACGIATTQLNVVIGIPSDNEWHDLGFKCNRCYRSFRLCDAFIRGEIGEEQSFFKTPIEELTCDSFCDEKTIKDCKDVIVSTKIKNYSTNRMNKKIVHFSCLLKDEKSTDLKLIPIVPKIEGLEILKEGLI